ncbi:hypothetical protein RFI_16019 [Reticulomyxa filosa]|uniref:VPS9 domain-containing protein n=1 Tax=Reticulomyxa filosa TaxID=46433 RepID=X6N795_RETFI|nr:hypothetical protein RFI_16019 [Reticulomyxa filosa]|eukprot:ETO21187.1 hypothetical protein RFI_16019 [Reticulomyxa filosa]
MLGFKKLNQYESKRMAKSKNYRLTKLSNEGYYYHEHDVAEQKTFDSFVLDQRTKKDVSQHDGYDGLFRNKVKSQYYECVRIFVYRCVLGQSSTQSVVLNIITATFQELYDLDEMYRKKTSWMRTLKHDQLQINQEYWNDTNSENKYPSSVPFYEAIDMIGELEKHNEIHCSPDKGINLILEAIKLVNEIAMRNFENKKKSQGVEKSKVVPLGTDDLFPIVVYCIIQSRLENPHVSIRFIELVLPEENTTKGQAAFSLSILKAAVQYIVNAAPEEFGFDSDIDRSNKSGTVSSVQK